MRLGMKYITRYDHGRTHGYWVRIQRVVTKGQPPLVVSQFFSDQACEGRRAALAAAKVFRDAAFTTAPPRRQEQHQPEGVRNGYGYVKMGLVGGRRFAQGWYRDSRGKVHRSKVSVDKWTAEGAKARVDAWLQRKLGRSKDGRTKESRAA